MTVIRAPFTADQVASLNAFQESEHMHPYTCGSASCPSRNWNWESLPMAAWSDGLHCIEGMGCKYVQDWVHAWTADWSWRRRERREQAQLRHAGRRAMRILRRHMRLFGRSA